MRKICLVLLWVVFALDFNQSNAKGFAGVLIYKDLVNSRSCFKDSVAITIGKVDSSRRISVKRFPLHPSKDTVGIYPWKLGNLSLPISSLGTTYIGYLGSDESQGFHVRIDNPFKQTAKIKQTGKTLYRTKSMGYELGFYSSSVLHTNIYLLATNQWKFKRIKKSQKPGHFQYALIAGAGYSRTFLSDPVYRLKNDEFKRVPLAGYNYLALNTGFTLEYLLKQDATVYLGYNALFLTPYNRLIYPRNQIQMGVSFPTVFLFGAKHRPK